MISRLSLTLPALASLSDAINGRGPDAPGLHRALFGLRAANSDDLSYLAAAMPLFDALYRAYSDAITSPAGGGALR